MSGHTVYTTSFRGLGALTTRELRHRLSVDRDGMVASTVRDYDVTRFSYGNIEGLGGLRTTEDVFYELGQVDLTGSKTDEQRVGDLVDSTQIEQGITCKQVLTPKSGIGRPTFRVIVQAEDAPWRKYRRERLEEGVVRAIAQRYRKWRRVDDNSHLEIWVHVINRSALVGLRMTDRTMRHRDYKVANLPGSLRPTIAAAAVQLSKPTDSDTFLDPNCGAGTILIERALDRPHQMLFGGDIGDEAISATRQNFGNRHKPWEIRTWDATALPMKDGSITRVVTNPPWGRQVSTGLRINDYYLQSMREIQRVLAPWGRAVLLTSEWRAMQDGLKKCRALRVDEQIRGISVMGRKADLFSLIRMDT